jgi:3-hydroxyacyl-CoA dehydrogenase
VTLHRSSAAVPMSGLVRLQRHGNVLVVEIDNPPHNALGPGVPEGLSAAFDVADRDETVRAIVVRGAGPTFVAGVDISMLEDAAWGNASAAPDWHELFGRIEDCSKPVVMAIHGTARGGGLELAMAGHYRVADVRAELAQPEVKLGIIPGAEGTQRLPRLAGIATALDMCVYGRPLSATDAQQIGIIDELSGDDLTAFAVAFARRMTTRVTHPKTRARTNRLGSSADNAALFAGIRGQLAKSRRNQLAPLKVVDAIEAASRLPFDEGCRRERELFVECLQGEQSKALIHLLLAERAASRLAEDVRQIVPADIRTVAIVGAGTMGSGIAMVCANAGLDVYLTDATADALAAGDAAIRRSYDMAISRNRLSRKAATPRRTRIHLTPAAAFEGRLAAADLVIEAVNEDLALKQQVFREIDAVAKPGCILATASSTLDVNAIASGTTRPASVVGLHFFSPAVVVRLFEIVRGPRTGLDVLVSALAFAKRIRKCGIVVGNARGFVADGLVFPYKYETQFLVEEGATPTQVDRALTGFGMAMGAFTADDLAGLDIGARARLALGHFGDPRERRPLVQERLVATRRFGQRSGRGWYRYGESPSPMPDAEVERLIRSLSTAAGIPMRTITDEEIVDRAILALVNEGARALEAGAISRASDVDLICVRGHGFPGWRGGPLFYADRRGLAEVLIRMRTFHREHGERWRPAPLLVKLAECGGTFRGTDRARNGPLARRV